MRYSAKLKWNLDFNQFSFVHSGLNSSLGPFPNHLGSGSETKNFSLGITLIEGTILDVEDKDADVDTGGVTEKARIVPVTVNAETIARLMLGRQRTRRDGRIVVAREKILKIIVSQTN